MILTKFSIPFSYLGKRIAISALLNGLGFHIPSIDIFECDENHNMDSNHFEKWIERASFLRRKQLGTFTLSFCFFLIAKRPSLGKKSKIVVVIDNAPWHNRLTDDTRPPKRSWRKRLIID